MTPAAGPGASAQLAQLDPAAWVERWEAALDELELDVERAEAILVNDHLPVPDRTWRPPSGLGPLPAPLRERTELLLTRQREVARHLSEAAVVNRRHARAVQSIRAGGPARPVYVDTAG